MISHCLMQEMVGLAPNRSFASEKSQLSVLICVLNTTIIQTEVLRKRPPITEAILLSATLHRLLDTPDTLNSLDSLDSLDSLPRTPPLISPAFIDL